MDERRIRRVVIHGLLFVGAVLGLRTMAHAETVAGWLRLAPEPWIDRLGTGGVWTAIALSIVLVFRLGADVVRRGRRWRDASPDASLATGESGTAITEFCLVFPLLAFLMATVIQMALIANASIVVNYAAWAGARAGIVRVGGVMPIAESIGSTEKNEVAKVVRMITATLSPKSSQASKNLSVTNLLKILKQQRWGGSKNYTKRFTYAEKATKVTTDTEMSKFALWQIPFGNPIEIPNPMAHKQVKVYVEYDFLINMPGVVWLSGLKKKAPKVSGVKGYVHTIKKTAVLQGTGSRANMMTLFIPPTSIFNF